MSDMGWRADGMARARAAGGLDLERYRRPGFTGGLGVRVAGSLGGEGFEFNGEVDPSEDEFMARLSGARVPKPDGRRPVRNPRQRP